MNRNSTAYFQYQFGSPPDDFYLYASDVFDHPVTFTYNVSLFPKDAIRLAFECNDPLGEYSITIDGLATTNHFCSDGLVEMPVPTASFSFQSIFAGTDPFGYQHWVYLSDIPPAGPTPTPSSVYLEVRADDPLYGARPVDIVIASSQIAIFLVLALLLGLLVIRNKV